MSRAALALLGERIGERLLSSHSLLGDDTAVLAPPAIVEACRFLHDDPRLSMKLLMDLTCVDYLGHSRAGARFEAVYHLYSPQRRHRLRLKVPLDDDLPEIDSVAGIWAAAGGYEREAWDLYGVRFRGHPDLRRILTYEEFVGHALRKDYPKERRQPLVRHPSLPYDRDGQGLAPGSRGEEHRW